MFKCGLCTSSFIHKHSLNTHEIIHSGIRFQCTKCTATFKYKCSRNRHEKNSHHIRMYINSINVLYIYFFNLLISYTNNYYYVLDDVSAPAQPKQVEIIPEAFVPGVQGGPLNKNQNSLWSDDDLCMTAMDNFEEADICNNSGKV